MQHGLIHLPCHFAFLHPAAQVHGAAAGVNIPRRLGASARRPATGSQRMVCGLSHLLPSSLMCVLSQPTICQEANELKVCILKYPTCDTEHVCADMQYVPLAACSFCSRLLSRA